MANCTCTCLKKTTFLLFPNLSPPQKKVEHQLGNFCEEVLFIKYSFFRFSFLLYNVLSIKSAKKMHLLIFFLKHKDKRMA